MPVATKRNSRVGRYSASPLASLGYWPRERPLLGFRIPPEPLCRCTHPACRGRCSEKPHRGAGLPLVVPKGGLEPPRPKPLPPQGSASTNSATWANRSEEHTSELQSLMRISYAVFCLKKKKKPQHTTIIKQI